jgi:hypothetical protein
MIFLGCGDRYWTDRDYVYSIMDFYRASYARKNDPIEAVIQGECTGADEFVGDWAQSRGVPNLTRSPWIKVRPNTRTSRAVNAGLERGFPALWSVHRRAAGPIRNKEMLDKLLSLDTTRGLIAFHNDLENSKGTKGMVALAEKAGISPIIILAPDKIIGQVDK